MRTSIKTVIASSLLALLASGAAYAQTQSSPDQGRVISSTPILEQSSESSGQERRTVGYAVTYEFGGRRYTTQMSQPPGATIPVQVSPMGVMTSSSVESAVPQQGSSPWQNVVPEAGMVVSGAGTVAAAYPQTTYLAPAYTYAAPVYAAPYGYGYAPSYYTSPFYAAPIGLSLNLGYSRGWGGGGWGGGRGRWR
jgi:hypothetical protein